MPDTILIGQFGQSNQQQTISDSDLFGESGRGLFYRDSALKDVNESGLKPAKLTQFLLENQSRSIDAHYTLVQAAYGGSHLIAPPVPTGNGDWSPTGDLREQARDLMLEAKQAVELQGYTVTKVIIDWGQGESDGDEITFGTLGYSTASYKSALSVLKQYYVDELSLDHMYISELGAKEALASEVGFADIRTAQSEFASENSDVDMYYTGAKDFINRTGFMSDVVHYSLQGVAAIASELSLFFNPFVTEYRSSIYTEVVDIPNCIAYYKFNGDGVNEVINSGVGDVSFEGNATTEPSTLITNQDMFATPDFNDFGLINPTPIEPKGYNKFSVSGFVFFPADFVLGTKTQVWSDVQSSANSGMSLSAQSAFFADFFNPSESVNVGGAGTVSGYLGTWAHMAHIYDGKNVKLYINNQLIIDAEDKFDPSFGGLFGVGRYPQNAVGTGRTGWKTAQLRFYNDDLSASEVEMLYNEPALYNATNTPVTPDAPVIVDQNNDTNTFEFTPVDGCEIQVNGGGYVDATSPYDVGDTDIAIGSLECRVKAEGVNPASGITTNTIEYTEAEQIDYTDVVYYANDLDGIDTKTVTVKLLSKIVQYKKSAVIRSEDLTFTPNETTGLTVMSIPDTDSMVGNNKYRFDFGNGGWYYATVPKSTEPIVFWDLPNLRKIEF